MKHFWSEQDLNKSWKLSTAEKSLLKGKLYSGRLLFSILLKHYQLTGYFPSEVSKTPKRVVEFLSHQIGIDEIASRNLFSNKRTIRDYCHEIRSFLGVKRFDSQARNLFMDWSLGSLFPEAPSNQKIDSDVSDWFREKNIEKPTKKVLRRLIASAEKSFENQLFQKIFNKLSIENKNKLNNILQTSENESIFSQLRKDTGPISVASALKTLERLAVVRETGLSPHLLSGIHPRLIERYKLRASSDDVWELKRHPDVVKFSLLSFYCIEREKEIIDSLTELIISIVHKISVRSEKKVISELVGELKKVHGKTNLLFRIAEAVSDNPNDLVRDVIFPVVGEEKITELVKEYRSVGPAYVNKIYKRIRISYANHYRRILPMIISSLKFRSNNMLWKPVLEAISLLQNPSFKNLRNLEIGNIPMEGVVPKKWTSYVIEASPNGGKRINRINYEICVLHSLREKLRSKEIWVEGAKKFCNPDKDLPQDFAEKRSQYYAELNLPTSVYLFINKIKKNMTQELITLNSSISSDKDLRIKGKNGRARISLSPLKPQIDPPNLEALKNELSRRWPATNLLDILKEADLKTKFTGYFTSTASRTALSQDDLSRKLLLTLYGLGTNAGLKSMASGPNNVSYKELLHIRRRYIHKDNLRQAIQCVTNENFKARLPEIWGESTTSCASDSTKFSAWDQNLITEWHYRYGGRGVMIYWHVDTKSACFPSQLKRCSSSEVASMLEGVLHHCTEMEVSQQYVDTHGQSLIAFAFCYLLGFDLMPRFKAIDKQKLVMPSIKQKEDYLNIKDIFAKRPINWSLIIQQYDELIKLAVALLKKTADTESILRRFIRTKNQHPTYAALLELGKAAKTMFLCKYLRSEKLRREIQIGLNVIERWNGVNSFIYFGKGGEISSNRFEEQEVSALSLHLLQSSMVYVNTLMIQKVLEESTWIERMTKRDFGALSPLPHSHINPYGKFDLDMSQNLGLQSTYHAGVAA